MNATNGQAEAVIQRWTKEVRSLNVEPARRLMLAVLQEAVLTLIDPPRQTTLLNRRMVTEAQSWVSSNNRIHPFAFLSICDALSLDPNYLRTAIREWQVCSLADASIRRENQPPRHGSTEKSA